MKSDIPEDQAQYRKMIMKVQQRMLRSAMWSDDRRSTWVRMYALWRRLQDRVDTGDEYGIRLGYALALVEQINSKITEPMLNMGIPFAVFPTEMGDGPSADNFSQIVRDFYAKPNVQMGKRRSKKEMVITGNRWEVDEWLHTERPGLMWGKVPILVSMPLSSPDGSPLRADATKDPANRLYDVTTGQVLEGPPTPGATYVRSPFPPTAQTKLAKPIPVQVDAEVPRQIVTHCGFNTRYPSVFDMYPEPERKTIDTGQKTDMTWVVEDMGELSLEQLCREVYVDPNTKATMPVYDFTALLKAAGGPAQRRYERILEGREAEPDGFGPLIRPNRDWAAQTDWGRVDKDKVYPTEGTVDRASSEDQDKIWVAQHREAGEILTVAQGRFIIHRRLNPWHVPKLRTRIENYTTDPEFVYGPGALEPIEDELGEMDDIHSMSMDNFFRLVNKMLYIREDAIVSEDDFKPRAGGRIRISGSVGSVREAVMDGQYPNVVAEMLGAESNTRGLIEFESSNLDGSPGVGGTKQSHKTKGGMETIAVNINTRFITIQSQSLINEALAGLSMQELFEQFAFTKSSYRIVREDGSTAYAKFNKDDIFTNGRGFNFVVSVDPTWGNTQAQRQDAQDVFDLGIGYEKLRKEIGDPSMRRLVLDKLFEDLLKKHGRRDVSGFFVMPDNSVSPEEELQLLMQGGIAECRGDLQHHVTTHLLQMQSPKLLQAVEANKADPDTIKKLGMLVQMCMARLAEFMRDPQGAAQERLSKAGVRPPAGPQ